MCIEEMVTRKETDKDSRALLLYSALFLAPLVAVIMRESTINVLRMQTNGESH